MNTQWISWCKNHAELPVFHGAEVGPRDDLPHHAIPMVPHPFIDDGCEKKDPGKQRFSSIFSVACRLIIGVPYFDIFWPRVRWFSDWLSTETVDLCDVSPGSTSAAGSSPCSCCKQQTGQPWLLRWWPGTRPRLGIVEVGKSSKPGWMFPASLEGIPGIGKYVVLKNFSNKPWGYVGIFEMNGMNSTRIHDEIHVQKREIHQHNLLEAFFHDFRFASSWTIEQSGWFMRSCGKSKGMWIADHLLHPINYPLILVSTCFRYII